MAVAKQKIKCLNCEWTGTEAALIKTQHYPEDDYVIPGEMIDVCPSCKSPAWEPES